LKGKHDELINKAPRGVETERAISDVE
jgi:hypothetical protein